MADQEIGFVRVGGHRIGYAAVGDGSPLVLPAWWVSNIVEDWKESRFRRFVEALAAERRVIRYDRIGCGISDRVRPADTLSLEFEVEALTTLLDHLELERVTLCGGSFGGCTAVSFAARNPQRVDRLLVYGSFASGAQLVAPGVREGMVDLVRHQWGLGSRLLAEIFVPSGDTDERVSFRTVPAEVGVGRGSCGSPRADVRHRRQRGRGAVAGAAPRRPSPR